jgi:hypothetical protein
MGEIFNAVLWVGGGKDRLPEEQRERNRRTSTAKAVKQYREQFRQATKRLEKAVLQARMNKRPLTALDDALRSKIAPVRKAALYIQKKIESGTL